MLVTATSIPRVLWLSYDSCRALYCWALGPPTASLWTFRVQEEPYANVAVMVPSAMPASSSIFWGYVGVRGLGPRVCKAIGAFGLSACNVVLVLKVWFVGSFCKLIAKRARTILLQHSGAWCCTHTGLLEDVTRPSLILCPGKLNENNH